jgi:hypothetical protein
MKIGDTPGSCRKDSGATGHIVPSEGAWAAAALVDTTELPTIRGGGRAKVYCRDCSCAAAIRRL